MTSALTVQVGLPSQLRGASGGGQGGAGASGTPEWHLPSCCWRPDLGCLSGRAASRRLSGSTSLSGFRVQTLEVDSESCGCGAGTLSLVVVVEQGWDCGVFSGWLFTRALAQREAGTSWQDAIRKVTLTDCRQGRRVLVALYQRLACTHAQSPGAAGGR